MTPKSVSNLPSPFGNRDQRSHVCLPKVAGARAYVFPKNNPSHPILPISPPSPLALALFSYLVFSYCLLAMLDDEYGMLVVHDEFLAWSPTRVFALARRGPVT